jgi:glutathione S-transferase
VERSTHVPPRIYHLALRDEWDEALDSAAYRRSTLGRSLDDVGFIHCSFSHQVQAIADLIYHGRGDVVLLEIDTSRLEAEVRIENLEGGDQTFPHIYGPLPVGAVAQAKDVPLGVDGSLIIDTSPAHE